MNTVRSRAWLAWGLVVSLIGFLAWSGSYCSLRKAAADEALENWNACRRLAAEIVTLRQQPSLATLEARPVASLTRHVDDVASKLQIPASAIRRIDPDLPRRVEKTNYREQRTQIELRDVTVQQLVSLLLGIIDQDPEVRVTSLTLRAPRNEPSGIRESWHAEITLTYFIFSPTSPQT